MKMPIKLLFLWCLQVTSNYLCAFSGDEWSVAESRYELKYNERKEGQMSKCRKLLSGIKQNVASGVCKCLLTYTHTYLCMTVHIGTNWHMS